jgi:predicted amidohydrolase
MTHSELSSYRVAAIQYEPLLGAKAENIARLLELTEAATDQGARLIVHPEMATTGYCWRSRDEIRPQVEAIPGPTTEAFAALARRHDCYVVVGMPEVAPRTGIFYNSAALVGPTGVIGVYRKTHSYISEPKWAKDGDLGLPVWETPLGRIGIEICYDLRFPEVTRTLALRGADLVAHPTNFPMAARLQTELITVARAAENRVYLLTANRVGKERWGEFCGWSQIVDPYGTRLAEADETEETLLVADVEVEKARDKDYVIPGEYELYLFGHRRPELYGALIEETQPVQA